jgi:hypothetical protein
MLAYRDLTNRIIGLAIAVHRTIGPSAGATSWRKPAFPSNGRSGCL